MNGIFQLDQKNAVVTGGGSGIGKAICKLFARQGASVYLLDLNEAAGNEAVHEITQAGGDAYYYACDVTRLEEIDAIFKAVGKIDVLVNNAGIAHIGNAENTFPADFDRLMNVNVKGVYHCLHACLPRMRATGGGVVLNLCSIAAHVGLADRFAYSTTKGAIHAMTLSVARDFLKDHIRCNSISPARVHTPFVDGFIQKNYPGRESEIFQQLSASQPIGRMGTPEEIAALALYLCSDEASFITGSDYLIDGGFVGVNT